MLQISPNIVCFISTVADDQGSATQLFGGVLVSYSF